MMTIDATHRGSHCHAEKDRFCLVGRSLKYTWPQRAGTLCGCVGDVRAGDGGREAG